jgi:hypothetical protein
MAASIVEELPGTFTTDESGLRGSRVFNMLADSEPDCFVGLASIAVARGEPYRNRKNEVVYPFLLCRTIDVEQITPGPPTSNVLYRAVAQYSTKQINATIREPEPGGPAIWTTEELIENEVVDFDINGDPIMNTSFQDFEPKSAPPFAREIAVGKRILQFSNYSEANAHLRKFRNTLNIKTFLGAKRGELKCISAKPEDIEGGFFMCIARLAYKPTPDVSKFQIVGSNKAEGWDEIRRDAGTRIYDENATNDDDRWKPITSKGVPIDTPVNLDGSGGLLGKDEKPFAHIFKHHKHANHDQILG